MQVAPSIGEPCLENENSWQYPWGNDLNERMSLDGVELGKRFTTNQNNPGVELSPSGYIIAVSGREFRYDANLGHHNLSEEPVRVGDPVEKIKRWAPPGASLESFNCWDGRLKVESSRGIITSFKMSLNELELVRILDHQTANREKHSL